MFNHAHSSFQVQVVVSDGASPPKSDSTELIVSVLPNLFAPAFNRVRYQATVLDIITFSDVILRVSANDDDVILQPGVSPSNIIQLSCAFVHALDLKQ